MENTKNNIYKGLKPTLKLFGLKQKNIYTKLKIRQSYLSLLATGKFKGSMSIWERISDAIGVPIAVIALEAIDDMDIQYGTVEAFGKAKNDIYYMLGLDDKINKTYQRKQMKARSKRKTLKTVKKVWNEILEDR